MSISVDSPIPNSVEDDFADFLDEALVSDSDSDADEATFQTSKRRKVEVNCNGSASISSSEDSKVVKNESLCEHAGGSYKDMCLICGQRLILIPNEKPDSDESRVTVVPEIDEEKRDRRTKELILKEKKLHLVLDLDHTLLNTTAASYLSQKEQYLLDGKDRKPEDVFLSRNWGVELVTKLRPSVATFLKDASEIFEMSVNTMGDRTYARQMVKLLDPKKEYFGDRVVSRDDSTKSFEKSLDVVCARENVVLVLDDTQQVWNEKNQENLLLMQRYMFFRNSFEAFGYRDCMSHAEFKTDECDALTQGSYLAAILQVLKQIHGRFFDDEVSAGEKLVDKDVRDVLRTVRSQVLKGCKVAFGCDLGTEAQTELRNIAEKMGAVCVAEVMDPSVTHVIETDAETENSQWAVKENRFVVHPRWILAARFMWQKQPEPMFSVIDI